MKLTTDLVDANLLAAMAHTQDRDSVAALQRLRSILRDADRSGASDAALQTELVELDYANRKITFTPDLGLARRLSATAGTVADGAVAIAATSTPVLLVLTLVSHGLKLFGAVKDNSATRVLSDAQATLVWVLFFNETLGEPRLLELANQEREKRKQFPFEVADLHRHLEELEKLRIVGATDEGWRIIDTVRTVFQPKQ